MSQQIQQTAPIKPGPPSEMQPSLPPHYKKYRIDSMEPRSASISSIKSLIESTFTAVFRRHSISNSNNTSKSNSKNNSKRNSNTSTASKLQSSGHGETHELQTYIRKRSTDHNLNQLHDIAPFKHKTKPKLHCFFNRFFSRKRKVWKGKETDNDRGGCSFCQVNELRGRDGYTAHAIPVSYGDYNSAFEGYARNWEEEFGCRLRRWDAPVERCQNGVFHYPHCDVREDEYPPPTSCSPYPGAFSSTYSDVEECRPGPSTLRFIRPRNHHSDSDEEEEEWERKDRCGSLVEAFNQFRIIGDRERVPRWVCGDYLKCPYEIDVEGMNITRADGKKKASK